MTASKRWEVRKKEPSVSLRKGIRFWASPAVAGEKERKKKADIHISVAARLTAIELTTTPVGEVTKTKTKVPPLVASVARASVFARPREVPTR